MSKDKEKEVVDQNFDQILEAYANGVAIITMAWDLQVSPAYLRCRVEESIDTKINLYDTKLHGG